MDPELIAYLDERFRESSQQIQGLREETSQRFDKVEEQLRLTDVRVEGLQGQIQLVAEGVAAGNESLQAFRQTVALEFDSSRFQVNILFKDLNQRVRDIELRTGQPGIQS
jgi:hypothetical protein